VDPKEIVAINVIDAKKAIPIFVLKIGLVSMILILVDIALIFSYLNLILFKFLKIFLLT